jgi:tellurite resistance protein TehA-like permease
MNWAFPLDQLEKETVRQRRLTPAGVLRQLVYQAASACRGMYPGYFALVMATGILSNAFFLLGLKGISGWLFWVNLVAYPILIAATLARVICYRAELWADLTNPELVFSFFTFVAASSVLGVQCFLRHYELAARVLWLTALGTWILLGYFSFSVLTFVNTRRGADVVHGGWLIAIVGTQSLVLLGVFLAPGWGDLTTLAFFGVHCFWGIGVALYGIFMTLFSYRIFFVRLAPTDVNPLFWVVMGAAAISTNAGSALIQASPTLPFLIALRPFMEGATMILWAWSTWWIPLLIVFWVWRHAVRRAAITYDPTYWSLVFPLGMYTVSTYRLSLAAGLQPLQAIPHVTVWAALGVWTLAMIGLLRRIVASSVQAARVRDLPHAEAAGVSPDELVLMAEMGSSS